MLTGCDGSESQSFVTIAQQAAVRPIDKPPSATSNPREQMIYAFHGPDGERPFYGVLVNDSGTIYGATDATFPRAGIVYRLTPSGRFGPYSETILYTFSGLRGDGSGPNGLLVLATDGTLFGTTVDGGHHVRCPFGGGCGTVYALSPSSKGYKEKRLWSFQDVPDGAFPAGGVIADKRGDLYGATSFGGTYDGGTVFRLAPSASGYSMTILHSFGQGSDGLDPDSGLTSDSNGALYGTTEYGGINNNGVVFRLTPSESGFRESVVYRFQNTNDGRTPQYGVTIGTSGALFGVAVGGCCGIVYELVPSGGGYKERAIHTFSEIGDGRGPSSSLLMSNGGVLYGETGYGGLLQGNGTIYKLTPRQGGYGESLLYTFSAVKNGTFPTGGLTLFNQRLYGVTTEGGYVQGPDCPVGCGTVFQLSL